jgi:predicted  nucleic acid-binding Zn-ribbon protein
MSIKALHDTTRDNKNTVNIADGAVCVACKSEVSASEIAEYVDQGKTAICPHCGVDALMPKQNESLINHLNGRWFKNE